MSDDQKQSVLETMRGFVGRIDELIALIGDKRSLPPGEKARAQALMKTLKEDLRAEADRGETVRAEASLNDVERAYLMPAIRPAAAHVKVRWNSDPLASRWLDDLCEARVDIQFYIDQLERPE